MMTSSVVVESAPSSFSSNFWLRRITSRSSQVLAWGDAVICKKLGLFNVYWGQVIPLLGAGGGPTDGGPTEGGPTEGGPTEGGPTEGGPTDDEPADGVPTDGGSGGWTIDASMIDGSPVLAKFVHIVMTCWDTWTASTDGV